MRVLISSIKKRIIRQQAHTSFKQLAAKQAGVYVVMHIMMYV